MFLVSYRDGILYSIPDGIHVGIPYSIPLVYLSLTQTKLCNITSSSGNVNCNLFKVHGNSSRKTVYDVLYDQLILSGVYQNLGSSRGQRVYQSSHVG